MIKAKIFHKSVLGCCSCLSESFHKGQITPCIVGSYFMFSLHEYCQGLIRSFVCFLFFLFFNCLSLVSLSCFSPCLLVFVFVFVCVFIYCSGSILYLSVHCRLCLVHLPINSAFMFFIFRFTPACSTWIVAFYLSVDLGTVAFPCWIILLLFGTACLDIHGYYLPPPVSLYLLCFV